MDLNNKWFGIAAVAAAVIVPSIIDHMVNGKLRKEYMKETANMLDMPAVQPVKSEIK